MARRVELVEGGLGSSRCARNLDGVPDGRRFWEVGIFYGKIFNAVFLFCVLCFVFHPFLFFAILGISLHFMFLFILFSAFFQLNF